MLRIKEEKWAEFCNKATSFGFKLNETRFTNIWKYIAFHDNFNDEDHIILIYFADRTLRECVGCGNMLYDLITQGFVEKVQNA